MADPKVRLRFIGHLMYRFLFQVEIWWRTLYFGFENSSNFWKGSCSTEMPTMMLLFVMLGKLIGGLFYIAVKLYLI